MSANICVDQNSPSPKEENVERENLLESSPKVIFTSNEQKVILNFMKLIIQKLKNFWLNITFGPLEN